MKVGYHPAWPATSIVLGVASAVLSLTLLVADGEFTPSIVLGPILLVLGVLQLTRSYFEFDPGTRTVAVKALAGPLVRRFGGADGGRLVVEGNRLVIVRPDGSRTKVPVHRFLARSADWRAVTARIGAAPSR